MNKMSVCMPVYNNVHTIEFTLNTALKQNYQNFEVVIVDDCSTDGTYELLLRKVPEDNRIKLYRNETNLGCGTNMQKCYEYATGEYLVYLAGDDTFYRPIVLSTYAKVFERDTKIGVIGRYYYWFEKDPKIPIRIKRTNNLIEVSDQLSGMGYRKSAMTGKFSTKPFVETASMVANVFNNGYTGALVHEFFVGVLYSPASSDPKMYEHSPLQSWLELFPKETFLKKNYVGLVQIRSYAPYSALIREIKLMVKAYPKNLFIPEFWFWVLFTLLCPRKLLKYINKLYREHIAWRITKLW